MPYFGMERREKKRIDAALALDILYGNNKITAQSKNISMLGTCVDNEQEIKQGTKVEVIVFIPAYGHYRKPIGPIKCQGVAFRCTPLTQPPAAPLFRLGIFFASFASKPEADKLSDYIDFVVAKGKTFVKHRLKQLRAKLKRKKAAQKKIEKKKLKTAKKIRRK